MTQSLFDEGFFFGLLDKNGEQIRVGDIVQYHNVTKYTKPEYWNPLYKVVWDCPCFRLEHVGGGKDAGNMGFILRYYSTIDLRVLK
jgi:hypothetical protein